MWLLIDAGNTQIKWALADASAHLGVWAAQGVLPYNKAIEATVGECWQQARVQQIWISNVAGNPARAHLMQIFAQIMPNVPLHWFVSSAVAGGLVNAYSDPTQLGSDRFAAAIGASFLFPQQALLVANCGTATTLDAISKDARFIGGMILPGLGTMANSLNLKTAQLPAVMHSAPVGLALADNTEQAILNGCLAAQTGAILQSLALLRVQFPSVLCILSGGAASIIGAALAQPHKLVENLVLHGLQAVAQQNWPQ